MDKLVIFDCDGVLVDSEHLANSALVDCLSELEILMSVDEALRLFRGRKLAHCMADIEKNHNRVLPANFEATLRQRMGEYFESKLQAVEGAHDAVAAISYTKCVASNGPLQKTKRNLEIVKLNHHFNDHVYSAYTIQKWKPDPELFLHACQDMGFIPSRSIVVEDSESGIQAALAGGFKVLAFGITTHPSASVFPFQTMRELPQLIDHVFSSCAE